jgi:protein-S-isoprenylcysteine O-methyltransferase Ste14
VELLFSGQLMSHPVGRALFLFTTTMVGHGDGWLANRLWLLGSGVVLLGVAGALLAWPQRLLAGEED